MSGPFRSHGDAASAPLDRIQRDKIRAVSIACSLLVCFNHAYTLPPGPVEGPLATAAAVVQNAVAFGLSRIATPFFFLVAAFLLFRALRRPDGSWPWSGWRREVAKRVRSLAVPFLLASAVSLLAMLVLQAIPPLAAHVAQPLAGRGWTELLAILLWEPVAYPLWFLRNLLLLCLAAPLIGWALRTRIGVGLALAAAVAAWCGWPEVQATRSVLFFLLGAVIAQHRLPSLAVRPAVAWALGGAWLAVALVHGAVVVAAGAPQLALNHLGILLGLLAMWTLADALPALVAAPAVQRAAAFGFVIYLVHEPAASLLSKAASLLIGGDGRHLALTVVWLVLGTALFFGCLGAAMLLERRAPALYALISGGRSPRRLSTPAAERAA